MPNVDLAIMRMLGLMLGVLSLINIVLNAMVSDERNPWLALGVGIGVGVVYQWVISHYRSRDSSD